MQFFSPNWSQCYAYSKSTRKFWDSSCKVLNWRGLNLGTKMHKPPSLFDKNICNPCHGPNFENSTSFHIYIKFWYSKRHGFSSKKNDLHPLNGKKTGFRDLFWAKPTPRHHFGTQDVCFSPWCSEKLRCQQKVSPSRAGSFLHLLLFSALKGVKPKTRFWV